MVDYINDIKWKKGITVKDLVSAYNNVGFQSIELGRGVDVIVKMKKNGAKTFLTFTSNMVTSGLRGLFAQCIRLGIADIIVTTVGGIEEDIMKSVGEKFLIGDFRSDDVGLNEKGVNRVGNIFVQNESYSRFEGIILPMLDKLYEKKKRWPVSEMFREIGLMMDDDDSILYQSAKNDVPIFCPAITDGAFGFHLFMYQQDHPDFIVDVVQDFKNIVNSVSYDDKKGGICLGGSISKHHAIFISLLKGGLDYAVYMTTSHQTSGSMSGATTNEGKSWGKIKHDTDAATINGDVSITFPLAMMAAMERLSDEGLIEGE